MLHWFGVDVLVIIAGWYAGPALTLSASSQMVRRTGVGVLVIIAGWYVGLASIGP
jgi:hypothetical protein